MKLVHGWAFPDADEFMARELRPDGRYQASHLQTALTHVTDWSLAIDAGAHVGTWARPMAGVFAQVIAVEPSQDTYDCLAVNMTAFGCGNVSLVHAALGATAGSVDLLLDDRAAKLSNTGARYVGPGDTVPLVTIDSWRLPHLGFLKLDIEGSELAAMTGGIQTLTRCRPVVLYENKGFGRRYGQAKDAIPKFLSALGFQHLATTGCDQIWGTVQ
jgi:FkbM family methyltransferase